MIAPRRTPEPELIPDRHSINEALRLAEALDAALSGPTDDAELRSELIPVMAVLLHERTGEAFAAVLQRLHTLGQDQAEQPVVAADVADATQGGAA